MPSVRLGSEPCFQAGAGLPFLTMPAEKPDPDKPFRPPIGRPSSYEPEFCDRAIFCGRSGFSFAQIAADLGVTRLQLYNWAAAHKPFCNALLLARDLSLAWWESQGMKGMWAGKDFNDRVMKFSMVNRFPDDYKDRVEVSQGLAKINWDAMTDAQLARVAAGEHPYAVLAESRQVGPGAATGAPGVATGAPGVATGAPGVATEVDGIPVEPSIGQRLQAGAKAARALEALAYDNGPE